MANQVLQGREDVNQSGRNLERRIEDAEKGVYLPKNRRDSLEAVRFGE